MTFGGIFSAPFKAPFGSSSAAPWYRAGGAPAPVAAYQPKGAASLAASYINLANPGTYNAEPGVAPSFNTLTGWTTDGTQWLDTGYIPTTSGHTVIVQYTNFPGVNNKFLCGEFTTNRAVILGRGAANSVAYWNGGNLNVAPMLTSGNLATAGQTGYRNGAADAGSIPAWVDGAVTLSMYIFAYHQAPATPNGICVGCSIQAMAIYASTLGAPVLAAVAAAMASL